MKKHSGNKIKPLKHGLSMLLVIALLMALFPTVAMAEGIVILHPVSQTAIWGDTVTFTADGTSDGGQQWQKDGG